MLGSVSLIISMAFSSSDCMFGSIRMNPPHFRPAVPSSDCNSTKLLRTLPTLSDGGPTSPPAPPKDHIAPSELEAESSDSECPLRRPPAKVLRNEQLMYYKAYNGPRPITYVDTRLYQGGCNDYIEASHDDQLIRDLLDAHKIPR